MFPLSSSTITAGPPPGPADVAIRTVRPPTWIVTGVGALTPTPSVAVYVNTASPVNPGAGTNVNDPSECRSTDPTPGAGLDTSVADRAGLIPSPSLASTPCAAGT